MEIRSSKQAVLDSQDMPARAQHGLEEFTRTEELSIAFNNLPCPSKVGVNLGAVLVFACITDTDTPARLINPSQDEWADELSRD